MGRLKTEEDVGEMDDPAMETRDYWTPKENVMEEGIITVSGCTTEAAAFYLELSDNGTSKPHYVNIQLTCGKCSYSIVFEGEWHASATL